MRHVTLPVAAILLLAVAITPPDPARAVSPTTVRDASRVSQALTRPARLTPHLWRSFDDAPMVDVAVFYERDRHADRFVSASVAASIESSVETARIHRRHGTRGFTARLSRAEAAALARHPDVASVSRDLRLSGFLDEIIPLIEAPTAWTNRVEGLSLTGRGQTVAIIDSGIDFAHPDLAAKNVLGCVVNCVDVPGGGCEAPCPWQLTDLNGHGTLVAGIAAANGGVQGAAPGADLVSLKVFPGDTLGGGDTFDVIAAIEWVIDFRDLLGISVINLSLGTFISGIPDGPCDAIVPAFRNAIDEAVAAGLSVVAATGNDSSTEFVALPACYSGAIAVSASNNDDTRRPNANYNDLVRLFAPGQEVDSTCIPSQDGNNDGYCFRFGTSMSTPLVAGAIAVMRQALDALGITLSPGELEQWLFDGGDPLVDLPADQHRRINVARTVDLLLATYTVPADVEVDGRVDVADLGAVLDAWGGCATGTACRADVNGDGVVNIEDVLDVLNGWGPVGG